MAFHSKFQSPTAHNGAVDEHVPQQCTFFQTAQRVTELANVQNRLVDNKSLKDR